MSGRGLELIATDEPTVVSKPLFDAIVVEDGQGDRRLPDPPWTDESHWSQLFCETNDLLDQVIASKECSWRRRGRFSNDARSQCKLPGSFVDGAADLIWTYATISILEG